MANLNGQNIGTNYKGILNLNTLNGNLTTSLQAVTDGDGNASPLQLSTTGVTINSALIVNNSVEGTTSGRMNIISQYDMAIQTGNSASGIGGLFVGGAGQAASARLHVKGDGTNPIALFETVGAGSTLRIDNSQIRFGGSVAFGSLAYAMSGTTFSGNNNGLGLGFYSQNALALDSSRFDFGFSGDAVANTAGTVSHLALVRNFAAGAGSASFRPLNLAYTINNSGAQTGTATGIFLNATETALNGMVHNLMDLQVGGASQFRVSKTDSTIYATNYNISASVYLGSAIAVSNSGGVKVGDSRVRSDGDGNLTLLNDAANNFSLLKFGGVLSTEPAIKKNGANLEFKNAADTGFCNISAGLTTANGFQSIAYNESFQRVGFNNGANFNILSYMRSSAAGVIILLDNSESNFNRLHFGGTAKPAVCQGSGTPEGAVTAPIGSIFMRSDGGVSSSLYVKQSGTGNTGWAAIA